MYRAAQTDWYFKNDRSRNIPSGISCEHSLASWLSSRGSHTLSARHPRRGMCSPLRYSYSTQQKLPGMQKHFELGTIQSEATAFDWIGCTERHRQIGISKMIRLGIFRVASPENSLQPRGCRVVDPIRSQRGILCVVWCSPLRYSYSNRQRMHGIQKHFELGTIQPEPRRFLLVPLACTARRYWCAARFVQHMVHRQLLRAKSDICGVSVTQPYFEIFGDAGDE